MIVSKKIEDFNCTIVTKDNTVKENISFKSLIGKNGIVLFFYPKDFTFVCPTEIIAFNQKLREFEELGFNVVGASTDNEYSHIAWKNMKTEDGGIGEIQYPIISDIKKEISRKFDILFDDAVALRATFILDNEMVVRHATINDLPLGRSVDETLRTCSAWNFFKENGEVCPAGWQKGKPAMKPTSDGVKSFLKENSSKL